MRVWRVDCACNVATFGRMVRGFISARGAGNKAPTTTTTKLRLPYYRIAPSPRLVGLVRSRSGEGGGHRRILNGRLAGESNLVV